MHAMENFTLKPNSKTDVITYMENNHLVQYEKHLLIEVLEAIDAADQVRLSWFSSFGKSLRHLTMNVHAYRKGLEFGFTAIAFDAYGWFKRPQFLDCEDIVLGNPDLFMEHSMVRLGRGPNHIWTYALNCSYGLAGGGSQISVYNPQHTSRQEALMAGLADLKVRMTAVIGHTDTINYKQPVILSTLAEIQKVQRHTVQLALF